MRSPIRRAVKVLSARKQASAVDRVPSGGRGFRRAVEALRVPTSRLSGSFALPGNAVSDFFAEITARMIQQGEPGGVSPRIPRPKNPGADATRLTCADVVLAELRIKTIRSRLCSKRGIDPARSSAGFTLLEVLLTSLLASIVLLALWSLSDIYLKLFVTGKRKIEETQLVRGLTSQFAKDISEVIQLPEETSASNLFSRFTPGETRSPSAELGLPQRRTTVSNDPSAQTTSNSSSNPNEEDRVSSNRPKPRFGLFGTKHALRLIVLEADPRATREPTDLADVLPQPGSLRHPAAPELRTIEYSFASGYGSNAAGGQQLPSGLVRREWAWETWAGLRLANPSNAGSENSSNMLPETNESWTSQETLIPGADMSFDNIPSVIRLEFHYYDGEKWQSEWDSWEKRKLPLLVEVLFQVRVNKDQSVAVDTEEEESDSYSEDLASEDASTRRDPLYRQLIHLPLGESQSSFDDFPRDQSMTDFATTVPRIGGRRP